MATTQKRSPDEMWLSVEQAADALGVEREIVRRWARDGDARMPAYRVWDEDDGNRGRFRYKRSDVEAYRTQLATQEPAVEPVKKRAVRASSRRQSG